MFHQLLARFEEPPADLEIAERQGSDFDVHWLFRVHQFVLSGVFLPLEPLGIVVVNFEHSVFVIVGTEWLAVAGFIRLARHALELR
jgi:hypothetical protein